MSCFVDRCLYYRPFSFVIVLSYDLRILIIPLVSSNSSCPFDGIFHMYWVVCDSLLGGSLTTTPLPHLRGFEPFYPHQVFRFPDTYKLLCVLVVTLVDFVYSVRPFGCLTPKLFAYPICWSWGYLINPKNHH